MQQCEILKNGDWKKRITYLYIQNEPHMPIFQAIKKEAGKPLIGQKL